MNETAKDGHGTRSDAAVSGKGRRLQRIFNEYEGLGAAALTDDEKRLLARHGMRGLGAFT